MDDSVLNALRQMLRLSQEAQLLFLDEMLAAASGPALRLFPEARTGDPAESLLGAAVEQFRSFSGTGSLLFPAEAAGGPCDMTVADCGGGRLVTVVRSPGVLDRSALLAISESFRQPLAGAMAAASRVLPLLSEEQETMDRAAELSRSLYAMLRLTGNLQLHGGADSLPVRPQRTELGAWLRDLTERAAALCVQARLQYRIPPERCTASVDCTLLERAVLNLISNAVKFSDPGSEVTLSLKRNGKFAVLTVRDQGCGIPEGEMSRIFCLSQDRDLLPDPRRGAGLGLPIAKQIVEAHGGRLLLESEAGKGTSVHIALRLAGGGAVQVQSPVTVPDYTGGIDHMLVELADVLPAGAYDTRGLDL